MIQKVGSGGETTSVTVDLGGPQVGFGSLNGSVWLFGGNLLWCFDFLENPLTLRRNRALIIENFMHTSGDSYYGESWWPVSSTYLLKYSSNTPTWRFFVSGVTVVGVVVHVVRTMVATMENITMEAALACPIPYPRCPTSQPMGSFVQHMKESNEVHYQLW